MIVYTFFLCFCLISPLLAQDGYKQWLAVQGSSLHLQENCRIKTIYASIDGDSTRLNKQQVQFFVQQRLVRDKMFQQQSEDLLYDIQIDYSDDNTAKGINLIDSSTISYAFTNQNKIRYYVIDRNSSYHIIYGYDDTGRLLRCKDCMDPFGNHQWCAYYEYQYDQQKRLKVVLSYNLPKDKDKIDKVLFSTDSLRYHKGLLMQIISQSPNGKINQVVDYSYDKKGRVLTEKRALMQGLETAKTIQKHYQYSINNLSKKIRTNFYNKEYLYVYQIEQYDVQNRLIQQAAYNENGIGTNYYKMVYE